MTQLEQVQADINSTRQLLWNASQLRRSRAVFRLQRDLDRLVARKYELLKGEQ